MLLLIVGNSTGYEIQVA